MNRVLAFARSEALCIFSVLSSSPLYGQTCKLLTFALLLLMALMLQFVLHCFLHTRMCMQTHVQEQPDPPSLDVEKKQFVPDAPPEG